MKEKEIKVTKTKKREKRNRESKRSLIISFRVTPGSSYNEKEKYYSSRPPPKKNVNTMRENNKEQT